MQGHEKSDSCCEINISLQLLLAVDHGFTKCLQLGQVSVLQDQESGQHKAGDQQASPGHAEVGREYYTIGDAHYIIIYFNEWYLCVIYMVIAYRFMSLS